MEKREKVQLDLKLHAKLVRNTMNSFYHIGNHWHKTIEISYTLSGHKKQTINGKVYHVKENDVLIVNSEVNHEMDCDAGLEGFVLMIDYNYVKQFEPNLKHIYFDMEKDAEALKEIGHLLNILVTNYQKYFHVHIIGLNQNYHRLPEFKDNDFSYMEVQVIIITILNIMLSKLKVEKSIADKSFEKQRIMNKMFAYIDEHYKQRITLDEMAQFLGYSTTYVSFYFKQYTGITFSEYLNNTRMEKCLPDLASQELSITEIALYYGFANSKQFNQLFKKLYHITPSQYRKSAS